MTDSPRSKHDEGDEEWEHSPEASRGNDDNGEETVSQGRKSAADVSGTEVNVAELEQTQTGSATSPPCKHTSSREKDERQTESEVTQESQHTASHTASREREPESIQDIRKHSDDEQRETGSLTESRRHSKSAHRETAESQRSHEHESRETEHKNESRVHSDDVSDILGEVSPTKVEENEIKTHSSENASRHDDTELRTEDKGDLERHGNAHLQVEQSGKSSPHERQPQKRDPSAALDPFHEPFTHPVRPPPRQVLGEGGSQPNTRESQRTGGGEVTSTPPEFATQSRQRPRKGRDHEVEDEIDSKFLPAPNNDFADEMLPESHGRDENNKKVQKFRRDSIGKRQEHRPTDSSGLHETSRIPKLKALEQPSHHRPPQPPEKQLQPAPSQYQPRPPRQTEPAAVFTPRQGFDEKLPPLNAQRQGLITKKYANYYFTNERVQQNLPQINANKLSDSIEAIHNVQQNERNKGLYLQTIRTAVKKLRYLRHYDSLEAHQAIYMLVFSATRQLSAEIGSILVEEKSAEVLVNMLKKLTSSNVFMTDLTWAVTSGILVIMSDYSHKNPVFARELADAGAIPVLQFSLMHKPVMSLIGSSKSANDLITLCTATMYSISCVPETDHHFDKAKVPKILKTLASTQNSVMRLLATMTLTNILFDHDPTRALEETGSVKYLVEALQEFARSVNSKKKRRAQDDGMSTSRSQGGNRSQSPQRDGSSPSDEGNIFTDGQPSQQGVNIDALELLRTLGRLSLHDSNKNELVRLGILNLYTTFLGSHVYAEQAMASQALWSLIAGSNMGAAAAALTELSSMDHTVALLRKLAERSSDAAVRFNCQALMWLIENRDYNGSKSADKQHFQSGGNPPGGQVFISYASTSGDLVARIAKKLRSCGFLVQPDPAAGPESLPLPAAIAALEASNVVLLCCSERYKTEPRCRCEAEMVNQLRRPAVYLRTDFHLNFTGWVANLIGHRDTLDISGRRYGFDEGLRRLMRLLGFGGGQQPASGAVDKPLVKRRGPQNKTETPQQDALRSKLPRRSQRVLAMHRDDVQAWLADIGLSSFGDRFARYDGQMVDNLFVLHHSAPEFVCQALSAKLDGDLDNVLMFFTALNKLYE